MVKAGICPIDMLVYTGAAFFRSFTVFSVVSGLTRSGGGAASNPRADGEKCEHERTTRQRQRVRKIPEHVRHNDVTLFRLFTSRDIRNFRSIYSVKEKMQTMLNFDRDLTEEDCKEVS